MENEQEKPTVSSPTFTALLCDDKEAIDRYIKGFKARVKAREKELAARAKAQQWTKANDDFEYNI